MQNAKIEKLKVEKCRNREIVKYKKIYKYKNAK